MTSRERAARILGILKRPPDEVLGDGGDYGTVSVDELASALDAHAAEAVEAEREAHRCDCTMIREILKEIDEKAAIRARSKKTPPELCPLCDTDEDDCSCSYDVESGDLRAWAQVELRGPGDREEMP